MRTRRLLSAALSVAVSMSVVSAAEVNDPDLGGICGRITDADRQILPGAIIVIDELHTGVTSDINGFYSLTNLAPGTYKVKISYVGYTPK